ncbi:MAG TPA: response regulator [Pseudolabrys sp.]|jgi:two-component system, chemotaxis family, chemotaxis protein CheY|nr:response regulator [Pseudolabrys sp.]
MKSTVNLRDLVILVADPSAYTRRVINGMLRGFGANKILEAEQSTGLFQALSSQKIGILLCDLQLPPHGGLALTRTIRGNADNENRTLPILLMTNNTSEKIVKNARDSGANMVVAKPMSPNSLYDRLGWIAFHPRPFVDTPNYFGPDRRFKIEGFPGGVGRRKGDSMVDVAEESGPALAQNDIDSLFTAARAGQS